MENLNNDIKKYIFNAISSAKKWKLPTTGESYDNVYGEVPVINNIGVIGGGTMGMGIAIGLSHAKYHVILVETSYEKLNDAKERIRVALNREIKLGRYDENECKKILDNIIYTVDLSQLSTVDMVIEAVFECMQIKKELFEKLQLILKKDCIVGSNTSSLDIDELANSIKPFNFIGIHFFNPPHVIKTIEIVYGKTTKGISVKAAFEISNKMKKFAVLVQSCPGFLFNRLLFVYTRIVFELINIYGFYPFKIDEIFKKFGLLMGPLTMCDMNGLDVLAKVSNEQNIKMNELEKYLVNKGDFGRKTGRGYYIYDNEGKKHRNFDVEDKIRILKSKNPEDIGLLSDEDIIHFVFFPYINEAYKCLEEGIVECPSHIDLMKIFGLGWPIKYGGPMKWATDFVGLTNIVNKLDSWFMKTNHIYFKVCPTLRHEASKKVFKENKM